MDCVVRLTWEGFAALCRDLARQVAAEFHPDVVVGVARGGTLPGALIALLLRCDFQSLRVPGRGLPATLPPHQPQREMVAGRRVLVVDERAPETSVLDRAVEVIRRSGAGEVRTLVLFATRSGRAVDYAGPEVVVPALQPWIADVAAPLLLPARARILSPPDCATPSQALRSGQG